MCVMVKKGYEPVCACVQRQKRVLCAYVFMRGACVHRRKDIIDVKSGPGHFSPKKRGLLTISTWSHDLLSMVM